MTGQDVYRLQVFLNTHNFPVAQTGYGSIHNETTYYGSATAKAVSKLQEYYAQEILIPNNLTKGTGFFGLSTRTKVNQILQAESVGTSGQGITTDSMDKARFLQTLQGLLDQLQKLQQLRQSLQQ